MHSKSSLTDQTSKSQNYFEGDTHESAFDRHCDKIPTAFLKHWHPTSKRHDYLETFAIKRWQRLSKGEKNSHTLSQ